MAETLGDMGKRKKNHAEKGGSPTLWLQNDIAPSVPQKLWQHSGVTDLMKIAVKQSGFRQRRRFTGPWILTPSSSDDMELVTWLVVLDPKS